MDKEIISRFIKGEAKLEEVRKVLTWYYSKEADHKLSEKIEQLWESTEHPIGEIQFQKAEVFQLIKEKVNQLENNGLAKVAYKKEKGSSFDTRLYLKIAASVLFVLSIGFAMYRLGTIESSSEQGNQNIIEKTEWVTKTTAKGQKFTVFLGDGTKVKLNSESSLQYPVNFTDSNRVVHLTGEAFFEVESDQHRPFTVIAKNLVTTALGTAFNVNAFPDQNKIIVSLDEGKVKIQEGYPTDFVLFLEPGKQAIYSTLEKTIQTKDFNSKKDISWKDGVIYFEDASWKDILNGLERWYGVEFEVKNQSAVDKLYTGSFNDESLKNVLESLSFSKDFNYMIEGQKVYINFN